MRRFTVSLLASTAFLAQPAFAADAADAPVDAASDAGDASSDNEIVVLGQGETIQVQEVEAADIQILTPGSSVIKAIEKLPSVNVQASDPFGNYEWSTRVTIRSFSQSQLGFNFDGIPLGDMSYGNHNGLHISRLVSPENVGSVRVSQGAGAVDTQSTNNLGGTVETFSRDPSGEFGVFGSATYGSNDTMRGFVRVDFGSMDSIAGYVSYGYGSTDKHKGEGKQDQHLINAKVVVPVGEGRIDGWFSYSDRREQDYQDMSLRMIDELGYDFDNTFSDYDLAILLADIGNNRGETGAPVTNPGAGTVYPDGIKTVDDAYYDASGLRQDTVGSLGYSTPIGDNVNFEIKAYYHHNRGMGLWATPYVPSPNGVPISIRTTEYDIGRGGVFGALDFTLGANTIKIGGWYEHNKFNQARRFYGLESRTEPGRSFRDFPKDPFFTQWNFDYFTDTLQYFVQDEIDLGQVKINVGWKGFEVRNRAEAIIKDVYPEGKFKTVDWFQPSAGIVFKLDGNAELFGSFSQATRAFPTVNGSIWGTSQAGFDAIKDTIKPETSDTYELGARYNTSNFNGTVGVYLVNFRDRLLGVASGPDILGSPSVLQNVGAVRSVGFEAVGDWRITDKISLFGSYTYTDATYRDDVIEKNPDNSVKITPTGGKTVVDAPKHMARGELSYDDGKFFGRFALNYMSKRYFTYLNDQSVPGRLIADAAIGYHFTDDIELQLNASNLFDKKYVGTINSAGTGNSGDRQTLLVAAPQQFFVTIKAGLIVRAALLSLGVLAGLATSPASAEPVLMISIDGLRPGDVIEAEQRGLDLPNLRRFVTEGAYATGVKGVLPTVTYPSHTTLLTGASPARHGIVSNTTFDPMQINYSGWYWYASDIKLPTLWSSAGDAGLKVANVHWPVSVGAAGVTWNLPQIWRSGHPDDAKLVTALSTPGLIGTLEAATGEPYAAGIDESIEGDEKRGRFAVKLIELDRPDFSTVYLTALDHEQHAKGPGTPEAHAVLERIDAIVGRLVAAEQAVHPDGAIAIVSDHGFEAVTRETNFIRPFLDAGLIRLDPAGKIASWDAMPWITGGSVAVMLARPDDAHLQAKVRELLERLKADPATGIEAIAGKDEIAAMGGNPQASFFVNMAEDATAGGSLTGPLTGPSGSKGSHGYFPRVPALRSTFMIVGKGIPHGRSLGEIDMRSIAPTLAELLGVKLEDAELPALELCEGPCRR